MEPMERADRTKSGRQSRARGSGWWRLGVCLVLLAAAGSLFSDMGVQADESEGLLSLPGPSAALAKLPPAEVVRSGDGWLEVRRAHGARVASVTVLAPAGCTGSEPLCERLQRGEFGRVAEELRRQAREGEDNADLRLGLADSLFLDGDLLGAMRVYSWAAADFPDAPGVHNGLGNVLAELGVVSQAQEEFGALTREPGYAAVAANNLGNALRNAGRMREAVEEYSRASRVDPELAAAHFNRGLALLDLDEAGPAAEAFRAATQRLPSLADGYLYEGVSRLRAGDAVLAAVALHRAEDVGGPGPALDLALGLACQQVGMHEESVRRLERALPVAGGDVRIHHFLVTSLLMTGRSERAEEVLEAAFTGQPDSADAHFAQGLRLLMIERPAAAVPHLRRALSLGRRQADVHFALGEALLQQGEIEEAVIALREAERLSPGTAAIHYALGFALRRADEGPGALVAFQRALALEPDDVDNHRALLEQQLLLGDFAGCSATGRGMVDRFPDQLPARFQTAFCLGLAGDLERMSEHLETALDQDVDGQGVLPLGRQLRALPSASEELAGVWLMRAMIHERRGDWSEAIVAYERFVRCHPSAAWARRAVERIHRLAPPAARP
ncbi:MAG TPA: tetratricopeptide repeat protein [Myxococcota bacterium]|nr:tetratricopeptide repeat protein [Myxococcota bacterium]HRY95744.1 tetratricopeptide repeat protein [Myxococcota bacterium]HSA23190.1 tetratricopeptide repeat protein [Myxococcota bacterium]